MLGAFQVNIPISTRALLFEPEGRLLSVLKWILGTIPQTDRWYLPFRRYVAEIGGRFHGFGGDPGSIRPDPNGLPEGPKPGAGGGFEPEAGLIGFTGKVSGLLFDRWGDFEGFLLDTNEGERRFASREHTVEDLATEAWRERTLIVVYVRKENPRRPETILLRHGPRPHWG